MRSLTGFRISKTIAFTIAVLFAACIADAQTTTSKAARGSETAKGGFRNEAEIRDKFNNWKSDAEARVWLAAIGANLNKIDSVTATQPHGEKADVVVEIRTATGVRKEGISIKLVSSAQGFNQIDKRWLSHYATMWSMPADVVDALKLFVGETPPVKSGRNMERMFLDELETTQQRSVIDFFRTNRDRVVADLFSGEGVYAAKWILVAHKRGETPRWVFRKIEEAIRYFGDGPVVITRGGNLKIGRITMQRKGGDGGRDTAKMLQFKIDPAELFDR